MKKKLIIIAVILTALFFGMTFWSNVNAEEHNPSAHDGSWRYVIGVYQDTKENCELHQKEGVIKVIPLDPNDGVRKMAVDGIICMIFDHSYVNGICKFCGILMVEKENK